MAREGEEWISGHVAGNAGERGIGGTKRIFSNGRKIHVEGPCQLFAPPPTHSHNDKDHGPSKSQLSRHILRYLQKDKSNQVSCSQE